MTDINRKFKVIASMADLHIGHFSLSAEELNNQLELAIIKPLKNIAYLDALIIAGDLLHKIISLNSKYSGVLQWFISELIIIARKHGYQNLKKCSIRILQGTKTHDENQLQMLKYLEKDETIDFRIIDTFQLEYDFCGNMKVAYIPEEYIKDSGKYYQKVYQSKLDYFDMIFGHGLNTENQFTKQDEEKQNSKAPIINTKRLCEVTKGPILFGHIHTGGIYHDQFFYIGSPYTLIHGDNTDKGFYITVYDTTTYNYQMIKIMNSDNLIFKTLKLDDYDIISASIEELIENIDSFISELKVDRMRLEISAVSNKDTLVKLKLLKIHYKHTDNMILKINVIEDGDDELIDPTNHDQIKLLPEYMDEDISPETQISLWSKHKKGAQLTEERILILLQL